jgi:restriction endonuclease S subunit
MAIKKSELYSSLWASCDELRVSADYVETGTPVIRGQNMGSTFVHLYQKDFVSFTFLAPPTVPEQTAIAEVLTEMDTELAALEQRREKTRALKQAMMQELLTGKTRLVTGAKIQEARDAWR